MSSSVDYSSVLAAISTLETRISELKTMLGSVPAAPTKGKKGRKNAAPSVTDAPATDAPPVTDTPAKPKKSRKDAPPTPWRIFTDRVRDILRANGYVEKALGVECVQFAATLKDENKDLTAWVDADILARRAGWTPPTVSRAKANSAANSVVSEGADKPKKERKPRAPKAKKVTAPSVPATVAADSVAVPTETPLPPSPVVSALSSAAPAFRKATVRGALYLVNLSSGHAYKRLANGTQGDWAGIFHRNGFPGDALQEADNGPWIDDSVAEPVSVADDELVF